MTRTMRMIILVTAVAMACSGGGVRDTHSQSDPPQFQLGDSVTDPIRAVTASHESSVAFYIPEKDLLPESVAYDPKDRAFYVGSTRKGKVVRVDAKGNTTDFITARQDGLWMVIGIKAHPTRRVLWVCSFNGGNLEGFKSTDTAASGVFAFNLDTGKLIRKWVLDAPGEVHGFNDLVLTRGNDAYITHMFQEAAIYRIRQDKQELELFLKTDGVTDINGITLTPDEKTLFVAGNEGVQVIDIATKKARLLSAPDTEPMGVIDGLYYYRDSLIGIRGSSINRYVLDEAHTRVAMTEVMEKDHPLMIIPTTGVLVDDAFYYVANCQFDFVNKDGTLATDKLTEPVILKLPLR